MSNRSKATALRAVKNETSDTQVEETVSTEQNVEDNTGTERDPNVFHIGDIEVVVRPFSDRPEKYAYDDEAEFVTDALPLLIKVMSLQEDAANAVSISHMNHYDLINLAREFMKTFPKLAANVCWSTNRDITEDDVKAAAKSPLHAGMIGAVLSQIVVSGLIEQAKGVMDSFGFAVSQVTTS